MPSTSKLLRPRLPRIAITLPDMGPLAGIVLALVAFHVPNSLFVEPEPRVEVPISSGSGCGLRNDVYTITIDKKSHFFFGLSLDKRQYQTAIIERVAAAHGINLTTWQRGELQKFPYMGMDVQQLPSYFALPKAQRYALMKTGIPFGSNNNQLEEYIDAARCIYTTQKGMPIFCSIRADVHTPFAPLRKLINILQEQNINRFNLKTRMD